MKNWDNILVSILGLYIFILPQLLATHTNFHFSDNTYEKEQQDDSNDIAVDSYCYICDFYLDQQFYYEGPFILSLLENTICKSSDDLKFSLQRTVFIQLYLRGPPFS